MTETERELDLNLGEAVAEIRRLNEILARKAEQSAQPQQEPDEVMIWKARALQAEAVIKKFMTQQEPVGYVSSVQSNSPLMCGLSGWERKGLVALYTSPPAQCHPLTDEQCRASFEHWYASAPDAPEEPERTYELTDEGMSELTKECIWLGWQAAHGIGATA